jgi:CCR4-NOT transcriptional regulation complex NOT5 subunit
MGIEEKGDEELLKDIADLRERLVGEVAHMKLRMRDAILSMKEGGFPVSAVAVSEMVLPKSEKCRETICWIIQSAREFQRRIEEKTIIEAEINRYCPQASPVEDGDIGST